MKQYSYLIFDADHTLLEYCADEKDAFVRLYNELHLPITEQLLQESRILSEENWTKVGLYEVEKQEIQARYHELYRSHVTGIFEEIFNKYGCTYSPLLAGERFLTYLRHGGNYMPNAQEVVKTLSKKYRLAVATNGLTDIQQGRLKGLNEYFSDIYVSETVNAIKPTKAFFQAILNSANARPDECFMIGDSLSSDVAGALGAGIDACWYNPLGKENTTQIQPTYTIKNLDELLTIL